MKNTCVSMNCPFISVCKDYNFLVDRPFGCGIYRRILNLAQEELKRESSSRTKNVKNGGRVMNKEEAIRQLKEQIAPNGPIASIGAISLAIEALSSQLKTSSVESKSTTSGTWCMNAEGENAK